MRPNRSKPMRIGLILIKGVIIMDIRNYSDRELELAVFNTEKYYALIAWDIEPLKQRLIADGYKYTKEQWGNLKMEIINELK